MEKKNNDVQDYIDNLFSENGEATTKPPDSEIKEHIDNLFSENKEAFHSIIQELCSKGRD